MLKLNNIEVVYSNVILVLRGVSLELGDGKLVALLGANGAGKSTTLKSISGLLKTELGEITHGSIEFDDIKIQNRRPEELASLGITQVIEGHKIYPHLTVEQNLMVGAYLTREAGKKKRQLALVYSYFPMLDTLKKKTSGYLSGGEQQMLVIGRGLMSSPKIMLLDEPSLGLSPLMVEEIFKIVQRLNVEQKTSLLLVEQNAAAALSIANYGYIMENGRVVFDGASWKLAENEDVREFYLGLSSKGDRKNYRDVKHYKRRKRWIG
jgi:branched-chain amino acid transport system ATP-binding protein